MGVRASWCVRVTLLGHRCLVAVAVSSFLGLVATTGATAARPRPAGPLRVAPVVRLTGDGTGVDVSGSVRCVKGDHVRVTVWVFEPSRGALAKGSTPVSQ